MIGYRISRNDLAAMIEREVPGWLQKATARTEGFRQKGEYKENSPIWSKVKPVYMKVQGGCKCAFCERKLESVDFGKGEQDIEHFRPKSRIRAWKMPKQLAGQGIMATAVPTEERGYYLLPYNIFNYASSCKPCNSVLKSDYFPIAGGYDLHEDDPAALVTEKPFLIYPIGDIDRDPEELIRFYGVSPQPVAPNGHDRARALVTIEFFRLDDEAKRKNLVRERAIILMALYPQLKKMEEDASVVVREEARKLVEQFTGATASHTNCARSFRKLFANDRAEAEAVHERACQFILSIS